MSDAMMLNVVLGIAILGGALAGLQAWRVVLAGINVVKYNEYVAKLLGNGELEKAIKLSDAIPNTAYGRVSRDLLTLTRELGDEGSASIVRERLDETLRTSSEREATELRSRNWVSLVAAGCAVAAAGLAAAYGVTQLLPSLVLPGLTAALVYVAWSKGNAMVRECQEHGRELVAALCVYQELTRDA